MKFDLKPIPKAHHLNTIGWNEGYVLVQFKGHADQYLYGPQIPWIEVDKVLRNPYPDRLFALVIKKKYRCHRIGDKP